MAFTPSIPSLLRLASTPLLSILALLAAGPGRSEDAGQPVVLRVYSDYV